MEGKFSLEFGDLEQIGNAKTAESVDQTGVIVVICRHLSDLKCPEVVVFGIAESDPCYLDGREKLGGKYVVGRFPFDLLVSVATFTKDFEEIFVLIKNKMSFFALAFRDWTLWS
jgi:hypothetical protein